MRLCLLCCWSLLFCGIVAGFSRPCEPPFDTFPFCNSSLSVAERVQDVVSRLTLAEKEILMVNQASNISRLGLPAYNWWSEALHGVLFNCVSSGSSTRCPTSFPAACSSGASFNEGLWFKIGTAISDEGHAVRIASNGGYGLDVWAPNININRDARWGRGQETPGEDPLLTSTYAVSFISGIQGNFDGVPYTKLVSTPKHFDAYSLENWGGVDRHHFNAVVTAQDLNQTYLPAFQAAVMTGKAHGIMCSYNEVNGVPSCANNFLLSQTLRQSWGFDGYVTSDCGAIYDIYATHMYANDSTSATADAILAGCDVDCGDVYSVGNIVSAVQRGLMKESDVDVSLSRLFKIQMEVGLFDPMALNPYNSIPFEVIDSSEHRVLALQAAREGMVLLKNDGNLLPLPQFSPLKVAVIGPHGNSTDALCSNYHGQLPKVVSILMALQSTSSSVSAQYQKGCDINSQDQSGFPAALDLAKSSDVVVLAMGIDQNIESEGTDRVNISFPGVQLQLMKAILSVNSKVVLVVVNGGAVDLTFPKQSIPAIIEAYYPGEEGGTAVRDVLFGIYNPSGRLTSSIYEADYVNQVSMFDMTMRASSVNPGRTYRFYTKTPVYEFGFGLSYTTFQFSIQKLTSAETFGPDDSITYEATVSNVGSRTGDVSVLGFIYPPQPSSECPIKQLFDFAKVFDLAPGHSETLIFTLNGWAAGCVSEEGVPVVRPGEYTVRIGDSPHSKATFTVV